VNRFVELPLDKHGWSPSPLPGQIVLVTTVDPDGVVDLAPKSWVSMAAFAGPVVGFGCSTTHRTARNVAATGEFVVNVPDAGLAARIWAMLGSHGGERIERSGLTLAAASRVAPPVVLECRAQLECRHRQTVTFDGDEVFVFGTVLRVAVAEPAHTAATPADRYRALGPVFFLEEGWCAALGAARPVGEL
jgi:flavin reductase (DIM6/NTAB) family NADH-FMN oxidoreductase RutF